nr:uncharacterized protein LOC111505587 [Leptinotarsa decemlineata]XP_023016186.1 uncharacterized protein LOC111505587 [Leptinotarsa decemlineata]
MILQNEYLVPFFLVSLLNAVLSQDVTEIKKYGCRWYGGSSARLVCDCQEGIEMTIGAKSIPAFDTTEVQISRCKVLRFEENSVMEMKNLRTLNLTDIASIVFDTRSLNWYGFREENAQDERFDVTVPSLRIYIYNSNVSLISSHAFAGRINEIVFDGAIIEKIQPFAFSNLLQTERITIRNSEIKDIEVQAFKRFSTEYLDLDGVTAPLVPSRAFANVTVYQNMTLEHCVFDTVRPGGFVINDPKAFQVTNSNISQLNGEAFKVSSRGTVIFRGNFFGEVHDGAFGGIKLRRDFSSGDSLFIFDYNTFSKLTRYSLTVEPSARFRNMYMSQPCECADLDRKIKENAFFGDMNCLHENQYVAVKEFRAGMCSVVNNYYITIIIVCVVAVALVVVLTVLVLYYKHVYRSRKYGKGERGKGGNLSLIVPDGRTYRETELHVIVEKTDLLTTDL